ncbi:MAG TPA: DinB family protein [Vicinamibacteria bacterium]|nr:DinB family protein [Vicinamibacteria bacterium]
MTPGQADDLAAQLAAVAELARRLEQEFSPRELTEAPAREAWSATDNLMHLTLASQALIPRMTRTLGKLSDANRRSDAPSRPDWVGRLYAWALEPPARFKARAPRPFVPPRGTAAAEALPAFLAEQERLLGLVGRSVGLDLAARKVPSPVSRYVRYNVISAFHILLAHQRRHLWQARRAALAVRGQRAAESSPAGP